MGQSIRLEKPYTYNLRRQFHYTGFIQGFLTNTIHF